MADDRKQINKNYWEDNIEAFSGFYDKKSEETLIGPRFMAAFYRKFLFPIEKKYMFDRYRIVSKYIDDNVRKGMVVADIGCGSGIFTKQMVRRGARVYAIDYVQSSLSLVEASLTAAEMKSVDLLLLDITEKGIPPVDLAISIGVLTYIGHIDRYFDNILPFTPKLLFNYLDARNPINLLRRIVPILDVRRLAYHSGSAVRKGLEKHNFKIVKATKLATGFVVAAERDIP